MTELGLAIGLVLVLEGLIYAIAPDSMKRMMVEMLTIPSSNLRLGGVIAMALGVVIVWLIRSS
ncbi:DUF2065 domain-containing protein [Cohaesibacter gelatinilyticus]|uniref:DUF2065 domain-containing protein n=1 Tax=Cohaesibacter gelatinilyticus TaxID=372072 RepID=A0A285NI95_9HYPH|nr:DUF2065 domain-containing protein [Cohaesibacter gelatinilyticus]SNZ08988.1 hypothetical protein SAMN06265368_1894 [Cohaesibacter gelatinilyticus]HAT87527.1 DUF2065 domain-containing protein [Hyphomicrobiales bacterium]